MRVEGGNPVQEKRSFPADGIGVAYLQVAVHTLGSTPAHSQITLGETVKEVAVFVSCAVLLEDFPHLRLKERHVYVDGYHLKSEARGNSDSVVGKHIIAGAGRRTRFWLLSCPEVEWSSMTVTTMPTCQETTPRPRPGKQLISPQHPQMLGTS